MTPEQLHNLLEHLQTLPRETEWVEFKHNCADPQGIGEYLSALSNGAALRNRLNIERKNYPLASRIIREAIDSELIRQAGGVNKDARYVPFWA